MMSRIETGRPPARTLMFEKQLRTASAVIALACITCGPTAAEHAKLASDCATAGAAAFEQYRARLTGQYGELTQMLDQPEYHFNLRLNTCLMKVWHWSFIRFAERGDGYTTDANGHPTEALATAA